MRLRYERVPENEWSMLTWAREAGLEVPEVDLVPLADVRGLPEAATSGLREQLCYAVRRLDRPAKGPRIHIEDFCQVFGKYPTKAGKYDSMNYESVANVILRTCGKDDLREFIGRLVFVTLCGNTDAHLKNWSLIYRDGVKAALAPAYDLVSTIGYDAAYAALALNFNGSHAFGAVSVGGFERLARRLACDPHMIVTWAREAASRVEQAWRRLKGDLRLPDEGKRIIEAHLYAHLPLMS